jgi:DNA helicase-2/ATP-dependent DNA helicase PcrA
MPWKDGLTGPALRIARAVSERIRVMAGPGTGKSFALQRRLMRLLEEDVEAARILVVTFTRTAAASLANDIAGLGIEGADRIVASTLHSYCFRLLNKQAVFVLTRRVPRPVVTFQKAGVLQFEAAPLLQDLNSPEKFGDKRARTKRVRAFEAEWARLQTDEPGYAREPTDAEFAQALERWLRFHDAMLIGELVPEALRFLRDNPASDAADAFEHVLVDEFQDLNKAEQVLIDLLSEGGNLGIVGDADQSIYSFRHAHPEGILEFADTHDGTDDHVLVECRRCPKTVVAMADHLIRRNHPVGTPPRLAPRATNANGVVHIVQWATIEAEVAGLARYVTHLVNEQEHKPGEILILCPRRLIGYQIRDALVVAGIPSHSFYHEEALEEDEAQEAFTLLTLLADPEDRVALRFWLGFGSSSWLSGQYEKIRAACEEQGLKPFELLEKLEKGEAEAPKTSNIQMRFALLKKRLEELKGLEGEALIDLLFPPDHTWARVLREAALLACGDDIVAPGDLLDYLRTRITQPEMPEEGEFVRIMSLHKSKGLTSRAVIVASCVEGLIPFRKDSAAPAEQEAILREQRRLFYVAITRCTEILMISSFLGLPTKLAYKIGAATSGWGRQTRSTIASRFLSELGPAAPKAVKGEAVVPN